MASKSSQSLGSDEKMSKETSDYTLQNVTNLVWNTSLLSKARSAHRGPDDVDKHDEVEEGLDYLDMKKKVHESIMLEKSEENAWVNL